MISRIRRVGNILTTWDEPVPEMASHILQTMKTQGCLVLEDIFVPSLIQDCCHAFSRQYHRYLVDPAYHDDALLVGKKRWMVSVTIKPPFDDPQLYANPHILAITRSLLGAEFILNSFGVVVSLPGAVGQHHHRDLPPLFDDTPIDTQLPCYAVTLLVPLVDFNSTNGSTLLRPGSHCVSEAIAEKMPGEAPDALVGSCIMMDYRLHHGGTANLSQQPRPLLFLVYSRPWFRDYRNFHKQAPLQVRRSSYRKMSQKHQALLQTAKQLWW